jgi:AcrR family transcriptional regulator
VPERHGRYDEKLIRILRDACGIFARKGYHNASVRDVAAATGVSPAGLYYYFRSKEELLYLILDQTLASLISLVKDSLGEVNDPEGRIRLVIRGHLVLFSERRQEMRVLAQEWEALTGELAERVGERRHEYEALMLRALGELRPRAPMKELRAAAMGLLGMLVWTHRWYDAERDLPVDELADQFVRIFLRGFLFGGGEPLEFVQGSPGGTGEGPWGQRSTPPPVLSGPGF